MTSAVLDHHAHAVAVHESAHAVGFAVLGLPFSAVVLGDDHSALAGAVLGSPAGRPAGLPYLVALLAGSVAEHRFTGRPLAEIADDCGRLDFDQVDEIGAVLHPAAAAAVLRRAHQLVDQHPDAIGAVAAALHVHGRLTAADVHSIVRANPGRGTTLRRTP